MGNPCYNTETKTDCPNRKAGCGATCPRWAKYVEERDKEYESRKRRQEIDIAVHERYARVNKKLTDERKYFKRFNKSNRD